MNKILFNSFFILLSANFILSVAEMFYSLGSYLAKFGFTAYRAFAYFCC